MLHWRRQQPFSLNVCLSSPASVTSADSFRLGIHMRATPHAPYVELALPLEEQAPPHPEEPIQRELALDEPEPETALWKCLHEEPSLFQRTQMASVEVGEEHRENIAFHIMELRDHMMSAIALDNKSLRRA